MAKNRIAPVKQLSVPRLELCGAVLAARLREKLQREMDFDFERVMHIVDSMIVRAQIQKESYGFGMFVATRVAEIQSKTEPSEWWWVSSDHNPADMTTRVTLPNHLAMNSVWQNGPAYLAYPIETWLISQTCDIQHSHLPDRIGTVLSVDVEKRNDRRAINLGDIIKLENFSCFQTLLKNTSIVMTIAKSKSFKAVMNCISTDNIHNAELQWVKCVQNELQNDCREKYKRLGCDINSNGLIVVGQRMADWMKATWNKTEFILLPPKTHFTQLLVKTLHNKDHSGVDATLAKLRSQYWIPGVRRIIKQIKNKCVLCRKIEKQTHSQQMGGLPIERLKPSPAFYYSAVDLFGPFTIKDTVKKRTHSKAYGVLFNCMSSRAVYIDVADGYDTDSFLMVLRRFVSLRGYPKKIRSDFGSQLVSARKEIKDIQYNLNLKTIESFGVDKGLEWEFTKSADAPWENGCSESLIKSTKRCLMYAIGSSILTFSELQTVFFEIANCVNERPIGTKNSDPNEGSYLCPNDLVLGRATSRVPAGLWNTNTSCRTRWKFIQQVTDSFWKKWQRDYFPTLIIRQKWHFSKRNLSVGDIVVVQDSNNLRGQWKLAEVKEAEPGRDGKVRDVVLRYKNQGPGAKYSGVQDTVVRRSVHRVVLILPVEEQCVS